MKRVKVGSLYFDPIDIDSATQVVTESLALGKGGRVVTPNLQMVSNVERDPSLAHLIQCHDLVLADGMPLVWASRLANTPLPARVTGSDLVEHVVAVASTMRYRIFLCGGEPGTAQAARQRICADFAGAEVVGIESPEFSGSPDRELLDSLRGKLRTARPHIVLMAFGFPKQERLTEAVMESASQAWFLNIGMGMSYFAGIRKRAPWSWQVVGAEWVWRLLHEPSRLGRRYLVEGVPSAGRLLRWSFDNRRAG